MSSPCSEVYSPPLTGRPLLTALVMDLSLYYANVNGLRGRRLPAYTKESPKLLLLQVRELFPDALLFTETHLAPEETYTIRGYYGFYQYRDAPEVVQHRGGTAVYVKSSLVARRIPLPPHLQDTEAVHVQVRYHGSDINLVSLYSRPTDPLPADALRYFSSLPKMILCCDLNARHTDFGDVTVNTKGNALVRLLGTVPLSALPLPGFTFFRAVGDDTHLSTPDYVLISTDVNQYRRDPVILDAINSDHLPILSSFCFPRPDRPRPPKQSFLNYNRTDWTAYKALVKDGLAVLPQTALTCDAHIEGEVAAISSLLQESITNTTLRQFRR